MAINRAVPRRVQGGLAAQPRHQAYLQGPAHRRGRERGRRLPGPSLPHPAGQLHVARRVRDPPARLHAARGGVLPACGLKVGEPCEGCLGTILFFHGGGWANGDVDFYSDACARTAIELNRRLVSVDLPPRSRASVPAGARGLLRGRPPTLRRRAPSAGRDRRAAPAIDPDDIVLFGDSAGGNLAAVVSLMARERAATSPRAPRCCSTRPPTTTTPHSHASIGAHQRPGLPAHLP